MASNFPSSLDTFTNPSSSDAMDSVSVPHATQHSDLNDAVEAIETALLDGAPLHIDDANERVGVGNVSPSYALDVTGDINASSDIKLAGDSMPRGIVASVRSAAAAGTNAAGVETAVVETDGTFTPVAGRKYRVTYNIGYIYKSVGAGNINVKLRLGTGIAGTLLDEAFFSYQGTDFYHPVEKTTFLTSTELGTSATKLTVTFVPNTNNGVYASSASLTSNIIVEDIGT